MSKFVLCVSVVLALLAVEANPIVVTNIPSRGTGVVESGGGRHWYWPFGSGKKAPPRLSEIMEPASTNIDAAADLMAEGRTTEALAKYRQAQIELDRIEMEHPGRAADPEFASVRTKKYYVEAAISAIETERARSNARSVVTTDTSELELAMKTEKLLKAEIEKADRAYSRVRTWRRTSVTNLVAKDDGQGHMKTVPVVSVRTTVVTNTVASTNALAHYRRVVSEIDAITSSREDRTSQPYFAAFPTLRDYAATNIHKLVRFETKIGEKENRENDEKRRAVKPAVPPVESEFEDWKKKEKKRDEYLQSRADAYKRAQRAEQRMQEIVKKDPDGRQARLIRAGKALRKKDLKAVRAEVDALLKKNDRDAAALNLQAACLQAEKKYYDAEAAYLKATELVPEDYHAFYNLARLRIGPLKDKSGARSAYDDGRRAGGPNDEKLEKALK